jgi:hypothetical protein
MSLGKLLSSGKSLVGLHDSSPRYQLQKGALPKFESAKNPFARRTHTESSPVVDCEPELPKMTPVENAAANLKKTQALPALDQQVESPAPNSKREEPAPVRATTEGWVKKLNPLGWWRNQKPTPAKQLASPVGKLPVQGELSLDNIKVLRNDLSETDVEVVTAKARPAKVPAAPVPEPAQTSAAAMAVPDLPPATNAWEYIGERLLGKH